MTVVERKNLEMVLRVVEFGATNTTDFPDGSVGRTTFDTLRSLSDRWLQIAPEKVSRGANTRQKVSVKLLNRDALLRDLKAINRTARVLAKKMPGLGHTFDLPSHLSDQDFLALAVAFAKEVEPYVADFVAYALPSNFLDRLRADIDAFDIALRERRTAHVSRAETNRTIDTLVADCLSQIRELDVIVRNTYADTPTKFAAWSVARRLDRPSSRPSGAAQPAEKPPAAAPQTA